MSGFALLCWVYLRAVVALSHRSCGDAARAVASGADRDRGARPSAGSSTISLCRSPLAANEPLLALAGFGFVVATSWVFTLVFFRSRRAHPHGRAHGDDHDRQRVLHHHAEPGAKSIAALQAGQKGPIRPGAKVSKIRSTHNNYITLPVVFMMLSSHTPSAFLPIRARFPAIVTCHHRRPARWCVIFYNVWHLDHGPARPWWGVGGGGCRRPVRLSASPRRLRLACAHGWELGRSGRPRPRGSASRRPAAGSRRQSCSCAA